MISQNILIRSWLADCPAEKHPCFNPDPDHVSRLCMLGREVEWWGCGGVGEQ